MYKQGWVDLNKTGVKLIHFTYFPHGIDQPEFGELKKSIPLLCKLLTDMQGEIETNLGDVSDELYQRSHDDDENQIPLPPQTSRRLAKRAAKTKAAEKAKMASNTPPTTPSKTPRKTAKSKWTTKAAKPMPPPAKRLATPYATPRPARLSEKPKEDNKSG
ncbi:hypothetical protein M434DRAFT_389421 [Hypoxylon sp. CO27-5]|nr:hypothetical protein M434DRAFT_389421 [Hypoxylon sp. CO27-5]